MDTNVTYSTSPQGWICPKCGAGVSPSVTEHCANPGNPPAAPLPSPRTTPPRPTLPSGRPRPPLPVPPRPFPMSKRCGSCGMSYTGDYHSCPVITTTSSPSVSNASIVTIGFPDLMSELDVDS